MSDVERLYVCATENRLAAAEMLAGLDDEQWATPSLCAGWTVREVAAHLVDGLETDFRKRSMLPKLLRYRGDVERMIDESARATAQRPTEELVAALRDGAGKKVDPPFMGPEGPFTDSAVHLRDMARPLGLDVNPPTDTWLLVLDFLTSDRAHGFIPKQRTRGLRFVATDAEWAGGAGEDVHGTVESLAMAITGRESAVDELTGNGVPELRYRVEQG